MVLGGEREQEAATEWQATVSLGVRSYLNLDFPNRLVAVGRCRMRVNENKCIRVEMLLFFQGKIAELLSVGSGNNSGGQVLVSCQ